MPPPPPANAPSHASGAFRAFCTFAGRRLALGAFDTAEAAWRAEDLAALAEQLRQEEEALGASGGGPGHVMLPSHSDYTSGADALAQLPL